MKRKHGDEEKKRKTAKIDETKNTEQDHTENPDNKPFKKEIKRIKRWKHKIKLNKVELEQLGQYVSGDDSDNEVINVVPYKEPPSRINMKLNIELTKPPPEIVFTLAGPTIVTRKYIFRRRVIEISGPFE